MYTSDVYFRVDGTIQDERQLSLPTAHKVDGRWLKRHSSSTVEYSVQSSRYQYRSTLCKFTFDHVDNLYSFTATETFAWDTPYNQGDIVDGYRYLGYLYGGDGSATLYWTYVGTEAMMLKEIGKYVTENKRFRRP